MPSAGDLIRASDMPEEGAWTAFTLTTGDSTNFTFGNATQDNAWMSITDKLVAFRIKVVFGSTSSIGGSVALGPLPFAAVVDQVVAGRLGDATGADYAAVGSVNAAQADIGPLDYSGGSVNTTTPFTWATGDTLIFSGVCEIE